MATVTTEELERIYRLAYAWHDASMSLGASGFAKDESETSLEAMLALVDALEELDPSFCPVGATAPAGVPASARVAC